MKQSIELHEYCLKNRLAFAERKRKEILRLEKELASVEAGNDLYSAQIELAKKEGKSDFDSERYGLNRLLK